MISKVELKNTIQNIRKLNGLITLNYIPSSVLESKEELYSLYYGGHRKMEIGHFYNKSDYSISYKEITDNNLDEIIDDIFMVLEDSIFDYIFDTLEELEWEAEELKYFDSDEEKYELFKSKILEKKNKK